MKVDEYSSLRILDSEDRVRIKGICSNRLKWVSEHDARFLDCPYCRVLKFFRDYTFYNGCVVESYRFVVARSCQPSIHGSERYLDFHLSIKSRLSALYKKAFAVVLKGLIPVLSYALDLRTLRCPDLNSLLKFDQ